MHAPIRIILVEDNIPFARAIARRLEREGYTTAVAAGGAELRRLYRRQGADLVLLDLNLGAEDGIDLARELTQTTPVGIIIMTGRDDVEDRIRGLDAGADDYLTKPFAPDELNARVRAVLRRRLPATAQDPSIRLGPVELDIAARRLCCDGVADPLELTETQAAILERLMRAADRPVRREDLMGRTGWSPGDRSVDVHIGHIRRKLDAAGIAALKIATMRGQGYRLTLDGRWAGMAHGPETSPLRPVPA